MRSVDSVEKSQSENENENWKKLLTKARETKKNSKSNTGKPPKKSNVSKNKGGKTRKVIPLDMKLCIIKMKEDGASNTKIARDKGEFFRKGFSVGKYLVDIF